MPRRTTRAKKPVKEVDDVLSPEEEQRLEEIPLLILDLRKQVKDTIADFREQGRSVSKAIKTRFMIGLSKIPPAMRNLPLESLAAKMNVSEEAEDNIGQAIDDRVSTIKSTVKRSARKRKIESAQKPAPSSATRRSSRKRAPEETPVHGRQQQPMMTPANSSQYPPNLGRTPFITPKFNTMTPLNRTVHRQARPNEYLVSHSGSPVQATVAKPRGKKAAEADEYMPLPLGSGLVLNLPLNNDDDDVAMDGLVLDDEQRKKVEQMRRMIDNVLKARSSSTEESD